MGLSRKRKQQLAHITARAAESHKSRKIDRDNQRRKRFLRKQREEEDFWDEHEDPQSESSSDESNFDESSLVEEKKRTFGMSMKTPNRNLALTSQTLMSLALLSAAPTKRMWTQMMEGGIIRKKGWETMMGGYNWKLKITISGEFGRMMQIGTYKE